mgnify:CR=1 FL=1|tara:strand:- start:11515 stop:11757 length:243 start_codon:yes stop_codon:yes gene_type:complete
MYYKDLTPDQIYPYPDPDPTGKHTRYKQYPRQIVDCECGRRLQRVSMKPHLKTKLHAFGVLNKKIDKHIECQEPSPSKKS